jgi:hypothetical protein
MPAPTEESRADDLAKLSLQLKKINDDHKRQGVERLSKSSNSADKEVADNWKKSLANDTSTMIQTNDNYGRRIGPDGRPTGKELKKLDSGGYEVEKKAKGGMVGKASKRADGIAQRGKTKGRVC